MRALEIFFKKQKVIRRSYDINDAMYLRLEYLSNSVYDASVNKIVCAAIDHLIKTENVRLYVSDDPGFSSKHTFSLPECLIIGLEQLSEKYTIGVSKLVNIAIFNVLEEECTCTTFI